MWFPSVQDVVIDGDDIESAMRVVPFSRRDDLVLADVRIDLRQGASGVSIGASAIGVDTSLVRRRCISELVERWCQLSWESEQRPLLERTVADHDPTGRAITPPVGVRHDATGTCAGLWARRDAAVEHGALEVIERHFTTTVFDDSCGRIRRWSFPTSGPAQGVASRWRVTLDTFLVTSSASAPAVALTVCLSPRKRSGAVGTAARLSSFAAVAAAQHEALMMYTTATHWSRQAGPVPPGYRDIVETSRHIADVTAELDQQAGGQQAEPTSINSSQLHQFIDETFGGGATYVEMPLAGLRLPGLHAWRVFVRGARSPSHVERTPWPLG